MELTAMTCADNVLVTAMKVTCGPDKLLRSYTQERLHFIRGELLQHPLSLQWRLLRKGGLIRSKPRL